MAVRLAAPGAAPAGPEGQPAAEVPLAAAEPAATGGAAVGGGGGGGAGGGGGGGAGAVPPVVGGGVGCIGGLRSRRGRRT